MSQTISREDAIRLLCRTLLPTMSAEDRLSRVIDYWVDEEDAQGNGLPECLRKEIAAGDWPEDVSDPRYDVLVLRSLYDSYRGTMNEYIAAELHKLGHGVLNIDGAPETMQPCPCCGYRTLASRGAYDICPVCHWEDTGLDDPAAYSGPNHQTLADARETFRRIGASSEAFANAVDRAVGKYARDVPSL